MVGVDRAARRAVLERLTVLHLQAGTTPPAPVARTQLRSIVEGWRDMLSSHQPDSRGRCPECSGLLRRRKWPCQIWVTAHHQLIGDGQADEQQVAPRDAAGRRRDVEIVARRSGSRRPGPERPRARAQSHPEVPAQLQIGDARIHRAAVIERRPTMPRARLHRRSQA